MSNSDYRMKLNFKTTILTLSLLGMFSFTASAQKFAYVDTEYILAQMPSYKSAQTQIDELSKKWQAEVEVLFADVDKMYKKYQAEKVLLTKDMQTKRENEIIEKEREAKKLQNAYFGYEGQLFTKRTELIKPIQDKVYEAIKKVSSENGLDFIFDKSGDMIMLIANPKYDRSDEVLEELGVVPTTDGKGDNLPPDGDSGDDNLPPR
jgi:outer membrane protein